MGEQGAEGLTAAISEKGGYLRLGLKEEYYKIVDIVTGFDQRLLTIKGWGVTFSLATAALGFNRVTMAFSSLLRPVRSHSGSSKLP
jgi:hypothetical protein